MASRRRTVQANDALSVAIPRMAMWEQVGGDADPGAHGGTIARSDGDRLEFIEIQPVRELVGDEEAADVGFPFWTKEASYDIDDLDPNRDEVRKALSYVGLDRGDLRDMTPTQRALVIGEALLDCGSGAEEGQAGWSNDIIHDQVKWSAGGKIAGAEYLEDEDESFRVDVLGEEPEDEEDEEDEE